MRRIRRWLLPGLLWGGVLLSGRAQAQATALVVPGSRAQVYAVGTTGAGARFKVPQVRLPNAAVARRINRVLLRDFTGYFDTVDSAASPAWQLRQAARECCYDEDTKSWLAAGNGLTATAYTVLLNQDFLLSLAFSQDTGGLAQPGGPHFTFDLRTGRLLTLADLLADPPAQLSQRLGRAINRRLRDELASVAAIYGDSTTIDNVARLYGFNGVDEWNTTPQHQPAADTMVSYQYPNEFALRPRSLLLFFTIGMARVQFEFLPDDTYIFPYERLHPRGLLVAVAEKAKRVKQRRPRQ